MVSNKPPFCHSNLHKLRLIEGKGCENASKTDSVAGSILKMRETKSQGGAPHHYIV